MDSLRSIDWRFLLPYPLSGRFRHLVLLDGSVRVRELIIEVGLADFVSHELPRNGSADAVIVLGNSRISSEDLASSLKSGGILYFEVDRRLPRNLARTPSRIKASLERAGLWTVGIHAMGSDPENRGLYLPLEAPGALRWYLSTVFKRSSAPRWFLEAGIRATSRIDGVIPCLAPYLGVTAIAHDQQRALPSVLGHPDRAGDFRQEPHPLVLAYGGDRVVMLPFGMRSDRPVAVLKVPKHSDFNSRTENEQATLAELHSRLSPDLRRTVPQPLSLLQWGKVKFSVESYQPGELLSRSSASWSAPLAEKLDDLRSAARWIMQFHDQTWLRKAVWDEHEHQRWVARPLHEYRSTFGVTTAEEELFTEICGYTERLNGKTLRIVCQHRDFNVWNISRLGKDVAVLDWEGARYGPALCDLLHFVTHWNDAVRRSRSEVAMLRNFHRLFLEPGWNDPITDAIYQVLQQYMERLEINRGFLPVLLVCTWVELALRRFDQQRLQGESNFSSRDGNRNFAVVALLAEHRKQLFSQWY